MDSALFLSPPGNWVGVVGAMKPGAHLLLFSSVKSHHVETIAAEDNGLEIRDTISYVFHDSENGKSNVTMKLVAVARKPLDGNVAGNVLKWGTGGLNIDLCRIKTPVGVKHATNGKGDVGGGGVYGGYRGGWSCESPSQESVRHNSLGRWPANLLHCGSEGVKAMFPKTNKQALCKSDDKSGWQSKYVGGSVSKPITRTLHLDDDNGGSAARFFYSAPCLNDLLAYLLKLVTPPNGTVLTNCDTENLPNDYTYVTNSEH